MPRIAQGFKIYFRRYGPRGRELNRTYAGLPELTLGWRVSILLFLLYANIIVPGLAILRSAGPGYETVRFLCLTFKELSIALPLLLPIPLSWLNPLVFGIILYSGIRLLRTPSLLLSPVELLQGRGAPSVPDHVLWHGLPGSEITQIVIVADLLIAGAALSQCAGFFLIPAPPPLRLSWRRPTNVAFKIGCIMLLVGIIFLLFLKAQGGVIEYFTRMGSGRFATRVEQGPFLFAFQGGLIAALIWYAFGGSKGAAPVRLLSVIFGGILLYLANGGRSAIIDALAMLLVIRCLRTGIMPVVFASASLVIAFLLLGVLGLVRASTWSGDANFGLLLSTSPAESAAALNEELGSRSAQSGYLAVVTSVPDEVNLLWGRSYVGLTLAFVPRTLWPEKPRSVGAMVGERIYGLGISAPAFPTGPVGEAYWNFYVPGVIVVFMAFGWFQRWCLTTLENASQEPGLWVLYTLTLFVSPGSDDGVVYLQRITLALAMLIFIGALIPKLSRVRLRN